MKSKVKHKDKKNNFVQEDDSKGNKKKEPAELMARLAKGEKPQVRKLS